MSYTLDIAQKAPLSTVYPALIAVSYINHAVDSSVTPIIGTTFVDHELVDGAKQSHSVVLKIEGDEAIYGTKAVLEKLTSTYGTVLKGGNRKSGKLEEEWIQFVDERLSGSDYKAILKAIEELDSHLTLRSFFVGYSISVADIAVYGALKGNIQAYSLVRKPTYINLHRWGKYMESQDAANKAIESQKASEQSKKKGKTTQSNFEIGLTNTDKGVVTRFPPEPSGYLHIGHAKAAMLNQYFANMYKGKMIVRFDDTNPSKEKQEYQDSILEDLALLGIHADQLTYTSDYFQPLYDYCVELITQGKAYCDNTIQETMRDERFKGVASKNRELPIQESLRIFTEEMKNATDIGVQYCVRAKISVDDPNKAMRDPVIYRCNHLIPHHRTGNTWKLYPTYDFACPIVDSIEGVTHALRTIEYRDRNDQYWWMLEAVGLRKVEIWDFARLNFIKTLLSKRKLTKLVEAGVVWGWDDPRFPTVRGIRRRGMTIEALREFILAQGPSKNIVNLDWTLIWAINKKAIDPIAPRFTAMFADDIVRAVVIGGPSDVVIEEKPKHKKNPDIGQKKVYYSSEIFIDQVDAQSFKQGEEITLMDWGNAFIEDIVKEGEKVTKLTVKLHLEGDFKKTEKKITWLSIAQPLVKVDLVDFDYLITKDKLEEDDKLEDFLNPHTEFRVQGVADVNVRDLQQGEIIQFERKGYYRLDQPFKEGSVAVFFNIPTGKDEKARKA